MAAFEQQNIRWIPPLPGGWEAKYDPTQKRYFFIDHSTKKTSWDDPRFTRPPPSPQPKGQAIPMQNLAPHQPTAYPVQPQASPQHQQQQHQRYQSEAFEDTSFMEDLPEFEVDEAIVRRLEREFPACDVAKIRHTLERNCNAYRATELELELLGYRKDSASKQAGPSPSRQAQSATSGRDAVVQKLKGEFPDAEIGIILEVVVGCEDNEHKARVELRDIGYQTRSSGSAATSPRKVSSPQRSTSSSRPESPLPLSETEKYEITREIQRKFPSTSKDTVEMVLESCNYKKSIAEAILRPMSSGDTANAARPQARQAASAKNSSSRTTSPTKAALSNAQKDRFVTRLGEDFPHMAESVILSALENNGGDEESTRAALQLQVDEDEARELAAAVEEHTEELVTKLSREFTKLDQNIIKLALEMAGNNEKKARDMLKFMYSDNSTSPKVVTPKPGSVTGSHTSVAESGSDAGYDDLASLDYYLYDNYARPGSASGTNGTPRTLTKTPAKTPKAKPNNQKPKAKKRPSDYIYQTTSYDVLGLLENCCLRPSDATHGSLTQQQQDSNSRQEAKSVVTSQRQVFMSENCTRPRGPDPTLREGPDITRVERYYSPTLGPNKHICHGPNRSLVRGPTGAKGPDPSLRLGPQSAHCSGPSSNHWRGTGAPMWTSRPGPCLVSEV